MDTAPIHYRGGTSRIASLAGILLEGRMEKQLEKDKSELRKLAESALVIYELGLGEKLVTSDEYKLLLWPN
jgi:hypothetical protein